jgi:hypothetical protein
LKCTKTDGIGYKPKYHFFLPEDSGQLPLFSSHSLSFCDFPITMPSFAFWKSSKTEESAQQPLLAADSTCNEADAIQNFTPKNLDLNPGNEDSGVFLFDESDLQAQTLPLLEQEKATMEVDNVCRGEELDQSASQKAVERVDSPLGTLEEQSHLLSPVSDQSMPSENAPKDHPVVEMNITTTPSKEHHSDFHAITTDSVTPSSQPTTSTPSTPSKHAVSTKPTTPQRNTSIARLCRPAELNLATNPTPCSPSQPRSELEQRYALIRNSKTQSKAALRSPTALLEERLNLTPKKTPGTETKPRIFTPPHTPENGCWIPGPGAATANATAPFTSSSIRASTEKSKRPAWWCKFDKLVVFDGIDEDPETGHVTIHTRTSKGLSIARRRGDLEAIVIPLDCTHCQEMLNRHEWKYDMRVCKRSVCWDCRERCKWEAEQEKKNTMTTTTTTTSVDKAGKAEGNRFRADSVLQDE